MKYKCPSCNEVTDKAGKCFNCFCQKVPIPMEPMPGLDLVTLDEETNKVKIKFYYFNRVGGKWKYEGEEYFERRGDAFWRLIDEIKARYEHDDLPGVVNPSSYTCVCIPDESDGYPFCIYSKKP